METIPAEIKLCILYYLPYKDISNLLLLLDDVREIVNLYPLIREKLKIQVSKFVVVEYQKERHESFHLPNGKKHGESKSFVRGKLKETSLYKDGKLNGERKTWWGNGGLFISLFKDGIHDGKTKAWNEKGLPLYSHPYKNGKREGESKVWFSNGKLNSLCPYKNGERDGECKYWYFNGKLIRKEFWEKGKFISGRATVFGICRYLEQRSRPNPFRKN